MSAGTLVATAIDHSPYGTFLRPRDIPGVPRTAVHMALSRAAHNRPDLIRVAPGVYWKGAPTRFGPGRPDAVAVARWRAGGRGVGPTGWLAANQLGLSTQVPAHPALTTVTRPPKGCVGVTISQRANLSRLALSYLDIALLEVLRSFPDYVDVSWLQLVDRVADLSAQHAIDLPAVIRVAVTERPTRLRANLERLLASLRGHDGDTAAR